MKQEGISNHKAMGVEPRKLQISSIKKIKCAPGFSFEISKADQRMLRKTFRSGYKKRTNDR